MMLAGGQVHLYQMGFTMIEKLAQFAILLAVALAYLIVAIALYAIFWGGVADAEAFNSQQSSCKVNDWLCQAMVQYCREIPDPCTMANIDQYWHPENPARFMEEVFRPAPIHAAPQAPAPSYDER